MAAFEALASAKPGLGIDIIYRAPSPTNKFGGRSRPGPVALRTINSRSISHCAVPSKMLPTLMTELATSSLAEAGVLSGADLHASPHWESAPSDREESEQQGMIRDEHPYLEAGISYLDYEDEEKTLESLPGETLAWLDVEAGTRPEAFEPELTEAERLDPEALESEWSESETGEGPDGEELDSLEMFDEGGGFEEDEGFDQATSAEWLEEQDDIPIEPEDARPELEARVDAHEAIETAFTSPDETLYDIADKALGDTLTELGAASTPDTKLFESAPMGGVFVEDAEISEAAQRCQQKWLAEVAAYPTEVFNAITNAPTHGALDVYLWAVRKGVRDETKLRRVIYFTLFGLQHGYCEPTTSAAKKAWKDIGTLIRAYKKWPQPPRAQTGAEACPKSGAQRVPPDKPALDITGRYYTLHPPATFVINQAGQHIEGLASYVIDSSSAKSGDHRPVTEFQGDLHSRRYQWFNSYRPSNFGQIAENKGKLFISQGVGANNETVWEQLRPISKMQRSTLIRPDDMDRSFDLIDRHELTPLTPEQMQFIRLILDKDKLEQIFNLYFNGQKRDEAMGFLTRRLVDTPGHASYVARMEKFHEVDLPLAREYAR
jgi:hypothetical protein